MELLCPHCFKRVAIPDDRAGQIVTCPACAKAFGAPALSPPPMPAPAAAPSPVVAPSSPAAAPGDTYGVSAEPSPPSPPAPVLVTPTPPPPPPEEPLPPPGSFTHHPEVHLSPSVVGWAGPACLALIFVLSFFPWHVARRVPLVIDAPGLQKEVIVNEGAPSLWRLAFGDRGNGLFLAYLLLTLFLAWPISVAVLLLDRKVIAAPPPLRPWLPWRSLIVAGLLALALLPLGYDYFEQHFYEPANLLSIAVKLAARLHVAALLLFLIAFWLERRRRLNLPLPKAEFHW